MDKGPINYEMTTYGWVVVLSVWGGLSGYIRKLRGGVIRFSIGEMIGDVVISGFVGVITFYLCEAAGLQQVVTAALVGISGHMGSRSIFIIERYVERWVRRKLKPLSDD